jgi:hypothetical protein
LITFPDIVKRGETLDNNWLPRLGIRLPLEPAPVAHGKEVHRMARMKALLIALGLLALAAFNGSTPWGP